jgi:hypothetical protein
MPNVAIKSETPSKKHYPRQKRDPCFWSSCPRPINCRSRREFGAPPFPQENHSPAWSIHSWWNLVPAALPKFMNSPADSHCNISPAPPQPKGTMGTCFVIPPSKLWSPYFSEGASKVYACLCWHRQRTVFTRRLAIRIWRHLQRSLWVNGEVLFTALIFECTFLGWPVQNFKAWNLVFEMHMMMDDLYAGARSGCTRRAATA